MYGAHEMSIWSSKGKPPSFKTPTTRDTFDNDPLNEARYLQKNVQERHYFTCFLHQLIDIGRYSILQNKSILVSTEVESFLQYLHTRNTELILEGLGYQESQGDTTRMQASVVMAPAQEPHLHGSPPQCPHVQKYSLRAVRVSFGTDRPSFRRRRAVVSAGLPSVWETPAMHVVSLYQIDCRSRHMSRSFR